MANIQTLTPNYFVDGETRLEASTLNPIIAKINEMIRVINSGGGAVVPETVAMPSISISSNTATITCATTNAVVYYTLDGSAPSSSNPTAHVYSAPITLTTSCTIKAIGTKSGMVNSNINSVVYTSGDTPVVYRMPAAFTDVDYASASGNIIKNEGAYVVYSANYSNKKSISYLMTNYAISGYTSNENAWWHIDITSNNSIQLKLQWNNNCAQTITNCVLRLNYRKGFSGSNISLEIPLTSGEHDEIINLAELLRNANPTSYENITHIAIHGVFSDTAAETALVDIAVKIYGINV